jgi:hypothetical protein
MKKYQQCKRRKHRSLRILLQCIQPWDKNIAMIKNAPIAAPLLNLVVALVVLLGCGVLRV